MDKMNYGPMLNAYPDSCGGTLKDILNLLSRDELKGAFSSFYILPSLYHTDLDRGFSVIDYGLNRELANREDLDKLQDLGIDLKLDFILNHASVLSPQFQDILKKGKDSPYCDFFIDWNKFWEGHGTMTEEGYIQPDAELIRDMFFRKPGLPILMVRMPDGSDVPFWNTFYQEIRYPILDGQDLMEIADLQYGEAQTMAAKINEAIAQGKTPKELDFVPQSIKDYMEAHRKYLGQMDLNVNSPLVWEHYENTLKTLSGYGAHIVRLDAFAYASKEVGAKNFFNDPGTWDLLQKVRVLADKYHVTLLPEIHASYGEKTHELVSSKGYMVYDFFLPGLTIDALERKTGALLASWAQEMLDKNIRAVNMLGCHDGIPLLDLKGLLTDEQIQSLIDTVVARGGYIKNLHGQKNVYYQVNATFYSALGADDRKMLLARALQMFMPGKPQIWYLDLFAGENDHEAVRRAGPGGHKEINRTNLSNEEMEKRLSMPLVQKQIDLLKFRNGNPAFGEDSRITVSSDGSKISFVHENNGCTAELHADLATCSFTVSAKDAQGNITFSMEQ
ncbi:MAG: glycosidase [Firmicutes bacterium]|nr:glycosidase [Bacillota bacterium]